MTAPQVSPDDPSRPVRPASHAEWLLQVQKHVDGLLSQEERLALFQHLETCETCRLTLEAEERLVERLSEVPRLIVPSGLKNRILTEVRREREQTLATAEWEEKYGDALAALLDDDEELDGLPVFANQPPPSPRRRARRWQRQASTYGSVAFALVAAGAFALTVPLPQGSALADAQTRLRTSARASATAAAALLQGDPAGVAIAFAPAPTDPASLPAAEASAPTELAAAFGAALQELPQPAELPGDDRTIALVLRAPPQPGARSFDPDDFADTIRLAASGPLQGRLARADRFSFNGHRFGCYDLELPESAVRELIASLDPYRAQRDAGVMEMIEEQGLLAAQDLHFAFYSVRNRRDLIRAVGNAAAPPAGTPVRGRAVRVVLVE